MISTAHTSRSISYNDLETLLSRVPRALKKGAYRSAILNDNVLGKPTMVTRLRSADVLSKLYELDIFSESFHYFLLLWQHSESHRELLAMLMALHTDSLLSSTADVILNTGVGRDLLKSDLRDALLGKLSDIDSSVTYAESVVESTIRNIAASWTQSGHLEGRVRKIRRSVTPTIESVCLAAYLARKDAIAVNSMFTSKYFRVFDASVTEFRALLRDAYLAELLEYRESQDVFEVRFPTVDLESQLISQRSDRYGSQDNGICDDKANLEYAAFSCGLGASHV